MWKLQQPGQWCSLTTTAKLKETFISKESTIQQWVIVVTKLTVICWARPRLHWPTDDGATLWKLGLSSPRISDKSIPDTPVTTSFSTSLVGQAWQAISSSCHFGVNSVVSLMCCSICSKLRTSMPMPGGPGGWTFEPCSTFSAFSCFKPHKRAYDDNVSTKTQRIEWWILLRARISIKMARRAPDHLPSRMT